MKATDLMIGDWVEFPHGKDTVQEITYVCGKGYCISFAASATLFKFPIADVEPITLTAEILDKNFREDKQWGGNGWFINDHIHIYQTTVGVYNIQYVEIVDICYVHELQHALRLCGIEKTIEL